LVKNGRILIVDDDESIRETLAMTLELEGYSVDMAENGKEAVEKSNSNFYNLAVVDWRLPDIEGTTLLKEFKETVPKMCRIMLTGYPSMSNVIAAVNNQADAFLVKPVDFDSLVGKIEELLQQQEKAKLSSEEAVAKFIETRSKEIQSKQKSVSVQ
jgi:DNA-binding NtrC family response regulator